MMQLFFTPAAARKLRGIIHDQGAGVALRIQVRRGAWAMTLEPNSSEVLMINGVPLVADMQSQSYLDGLVIDWVQTPHGQGLAIYDRNLQKLEMRLGAD
jgi:Fe-S cluster assembly iron-binding protein IscA